MDEMMRGASKEKKVLTTIAIALFFSWNIVKVVIQRKMMDGIHTYIHKSKSPLLYSFIHSILSKTQPANKGHIIWNEMRKEGRTDVRINRRDLKISKFIERENQPGSKPQHQSIYTQEVFFRRLSFTCWDWKIKS